MNSIAAETEFICHNVKNTYKTKVQYTQMAGYQTDTIMLVAYSNVILYLETE